MFCDFWLCLSSFSFFFLVVQPVYGCCSFVLHESASLALLFCRCCGELLASSNSIDAVEARPRLRLGKIPLRAMKNLADQMKNGQCY